MGAISSLLASSRLLQSGAHISCRRCDIRQCKGIECIHILVHLQIFSEKRRKKTGIICLGDFRTRMLIFWCPARSQEVPHFWPLPSSGRGYVNDTFLWQCVSVWHATFFIPLLLLLLRRTANPPLDSGPINALLAPTRHAMTEQDISHRRKKEKLFCVPLCHFRLSQQPDPEYPISRSQRSHALATHTHTTTTTTARSPCALRSMPPPPSSLPSRLFTVLGEKSEGRSRNERTNGVCGESKWREEGSFRLLFLFAPLLEGERRLNHAHTLGTWYYYGTAKWQARLGMGFANNCYFKNGISSTQYDIDISVFI